MKLNLGCGSQVPDGWINVDYAMGARLTKIPFFRSLNAKLKLFNLNWNENIYLHDLRKKFPWKDESIDVVYSSHTLEHLSRVDGENFLIECYRVLRTNGIIRIIVPDLRCCVISYLEGRVNAEDFVEHLGVLYGNSPNKIKRRLSPFFEFPHKCMYDHPSLIEILNKIGFQTSARTAFDSDIEDIQTVELEGRTENSVIVEGRKR